MNEEILTLLRENNAMLKRICAWLDKTESAEWQTNNDIKEFVLNCAANWITSPRADIQHIRPQNYNEQTFWR